MFVLFGLPVARTQQEIEIALCQSGLGRILARERLRRKRERRRLEHIRWTRAEKMSLIPLIVLMLLAVAAGGWLGFTYKH